MIILKLVLSLSLIESIVSSGVTSKYKLFQGYPVSGVNIVDHLIRRSTIHCSISCADVSECHGFVYHSTNCDDVTTEPGSCRLVSVTDAGVVFGPANSTCVEFYAVDSCWNRRKQVKNLCTN